MAAARKLKEQNWPHKYGPLEFTVDGLGVACMTDSLKARIAALSLEDAKAANRAAWKVRRESTRIANRHCNWSQSGNISIYEQHYMYANWAELVCRETYKRMIRA